MAECVQQDGRRLLSLSRIADLVALMQDATLVQPQAPQPGASSTTTSI